MKIIHEEKTRPTKEFALSQHFYLTILMNLGLPMASSTLTQTRKTSLLIILPSLESFSFFFLIGWYYIHPIQPIALISAILIQSAWGRERYQAENWMITAICNRMSFPFPIVFFFLIIVIN
jgi:hypothetical protein